MSDTTAQVLIFVLGTLSSCSSQPSPNRATGISVAMLALAGIGVFHFARARLPSRRLTATLLFISSLQDLLGKSVSLEYIVDPGTCRHLGQRLIECQRQASLHHLQLVHMSTMSWGRYISSFRKLSVAVQDTQTYAEALRQDILALCELPTGIPSP